MIVRPRLSWLRMLFVWHGSVVPKILPRLGALFAFACLVTWLHEQVWPIPVRLEATSLALLGVTLAIFLGFRNSTSYDRFWEARKQWGELIISARSFSRQAFSLPDPALSLEERKRVALLLGAFALTLSSQLREGKPRDGYGAVRDAPSALPDFGARLEEASYRPALVLLELGAWLGELRRQGRVDAILCAAMDRNLDHLSRVVGACERIGSTPIPFVYSVLLHRTVYAYASLLPVALVEHIGWWTPWMTLFVAYTLIALDEVTAELEEPFGVEPNDLPLDALARTVERSTLELAGASLPPPLAPDEHYTLR
ncbi:MAG: hypothetical protein KIS78_16995 [Labilithrix sp.]|nr:hypothetical protein [Labilithrix sp.]MCW5834099.1 hypothetical protein [Labilithrix sp.]